MIKIDKLLDNVNIEKRERIINSALKEFSQNTFDKASTNTIVKEANVSKGTLFHYFESKEKLYNYLEYFAVNAVTNAVVKDIDWEQKDLFSRLKQTVISKFKVFLKYPYLADFSMVVLGSKSPEEFKLIDPKFAHDLYEKVYKHNIDYSLFKDDVDVSRAINILMWTLEKYSEQLLMELNNSDKILDKKDIERELFIYMDMLKTSFYK